MDLTMRPEDLNNSMRVEKSDRFANTTGFERYNDPIKRFGIFKRYNKCNATKRFKHLKHLYIQITTACKL